VEGREVVIWGKYAISWAGGPDFEAIVLELVIDVLICKTVVLWREVEIAMRKRQRGA